MSSDSEQGRQWDELYGQLRSLLSSHGKESAFGDGDFWLVDDNWGGHLQKVSVFKLEFLTQSLTQKVQTVLNQFGDKQWGVMFSLELKNQGETVPTVPPEGITVYPDRIEQAWDAQRLRALLGSRFVW